MNKITTVKVSQDTLQKLNDIRESLLPEMNAKADQAEKLFPGVRVNRGISHDQIIREMITQWEDQRE